MLGALCFVGEANEASACRCREPMVGTAYRRAALVVLAETVAVRSRPEIQGQTVIVRVHNAWKEDSPEELTIVTGSDCAYMMKLGEKHLLFLSPAEGDSFTTGKCMGDRAAGDAKSSLSWLRRHGTVATIAGAPK